MKPKIKNTTTAVLNLSVMFGQKTNLISLCGSELLLLMWAGLTDWLAVLPLRWQLRQANEFHPVCPHRRGGEAHPYSFMQKVVLLHLITPSCRKRSSISLHSHMKMEKVQLLLTPSCWRRWCSSSSPVILLTLSCRRCTSRCSPSAAAPPSAWWRSCWRWSARNYKCWRSSGRFLGAPDTQRRAGPWSLSNSYLMMSEIGLRPHHLHLCAAAYTGNNITVTVSSLFYLLFPEVTNTWHKLNNIIPAKIISRHFTL